MAKLGSAYRKLLREKGLTTTASPRNGTPGSYVLESFKARNIISDAPHNLVIEKIRGVSKWYGRIGGNRRTTGISITHPLLNDVVRAAMSRFV